VKDDTPRERSSTVEEICQKALDLDPADREAFLDAACGQDRGLRREAESLLAYEHAANHFLTTPAFQPQPDSRGADAGLLIGSRIGPYEVLSPLGSGGMADVYRARDTRLGRDVALKRPAAGVRSNPSRRARLQREARLLASLNHPHIAAIYDVVEVAESDLLVLELVEGETLGQRLEDARAIRGTLPPAEALALARQIADAIHAAHRKGIRHGDLKPANIVVTPEGTAKVVDFGIGQLTVDVGGHPAVEPLPGQEDERPQRELVGTPAYMSPEQLKGACDLRADIWAFGCVLYEMVSGRQAFAAGPSASDTLARVLLDEPDWDALPNELPETVRVLLRLCLEKKIDARLGTMREALALISRALEDIGDARTAGDDTGTLAVRSLAVLPLVGENMGTDGAVLGDGIAESIVQRLSEVPGLTVLAANTGRHYKEEWTRNPGLAAAWGVRGVLTGRIRAARDQCTVNVQLASTLDNMELWAGEYGRAIDALADIHEAIAADVRDWLGVGLRSGERRAAPKTHTVRNEAYRHYLRGRYAWNKRTATGLKQALLYFQEAIQLDPSYALAFAAIADCHILSPLYDRAMPDVAYRAAKAAAERALALDPRLAEAHVAIGQLRLYYEWDWSAAEEALLRAIELAPGSSSAHNVCGNYCAAVGQLDRALVKCSEALALDPVSLAMNLDLGIVFYFARRYTAAAGQLLTTIELDEHFAPAQAMLGRVYAQSGRFAEARQAGEAALARDDAPWVLATLGYTHALAGDMATARRIERTLHARRAKERVAPYDLAILHGLIGEHDEAFACLRAAYDERSGVLVWGLVNDPMLDGLRSDARFGALLENAKLRPRIA
jgi:eukaryotic-like serine/threonine-protein kinase